MGTHPPQEPYASAPLAGGDRVDPYAGFSPVGSDRTTTVGESYQGGLEDAARAGVQVLGRRREDGTFVFPGTESINRSRVFSGPGYLAPRPPQTRWAVPGVWISAIGLVVFPLLLVGIVFGALGLQETREGTIAGRGASRTAVTIGAMGAVLWLMFWIAWQLTRS
ncbi:MAG: hypothetical protein Q4G64_03305 [bacterium]|nr:hypothetical protein [bacterium]